MGRQKHTAEQIISKLREAEVLQGKGMSLEEVLRQLNISDATYYKWRKEYGGLRLDQAKRLKELEQENSRLRKVVSDLSIDNAILKEAAPGKLVSPVKRRRAVRELQEALQASERRVCRVLEQPRSTQRRPAVVKTDEAALRERMITLACEYGRYGYRRVTALLRGEGWRVNHKRVARIWRQEGLKVPKRQPKRRRLWLNDGSCIRLRPEHRNHVWSYDFVADRTSDGRPIRMLNIIDEYSRECLKIHIDRQVKATDVLYELSELFVERGAPDYLRSDNGCEFTAQPIREWLQRLGVKTLFIEPGSPWENGYIESFNGKLRDELLNGEIFDTVLEAKVITERWRKQYNTIRPHSSLQYRPPAPETYFLRQVANA
ncbi:MAG: IS3 family transposase [Ignavibacteria bacterium]|nr:IS3 family transposase [Ignavibacteria bacterium]MBM4160085.1 IS3 family transposase [Ignavibacteria bacterium]